MKKSLISVVRGYQIFASPYLAPACRYQPTCSNYAIEALDRFGPVTGGWLAIKRICRCHPGYPGGYDPVPPE